MTWKEGFALRRPYFILAAAVVLLDQASKLAAEAWLRGRGPVVVIPGFFNLIYSRNRGGLFGYFANLPESIRVGLLTALPLVVIVAVSLYLVKTDEPDRSTLAGLGLIVGGASGNLIDRLVRGEVVDFFDAYVSSPGLAAWFREHLHQTHWPTFNLADSAIVIATALLILDVLRPDRKKAPGDASHPA